MSATKRVVLTIALLVAFVAILFAEGWLNGWLKRWITGLPASIILARALSKTCSVGVWLLPLLFFPKLRDVGSFRLPPTWTVFLVLPMVLLNLAFFGRLPTDMPLSFYVYFVWGGMAGGVVEELVFRGYAFCLFPGRRPRLVVFASAVCFAVMHFVNLTHEPLYVVLYNLPWVFVLGLGLGIIRIVTGSLAWCMLLHGTLNATLEFAIGDGDYQMVFPAVVATCGIASVATFAVHPKLRSLSGGNDMRLTAGE